MGKIIVEIEPVFLYIQKMEGCIEAKKHENHDMLNDYDFVK